MWFTFLYCLRWQRTAVERQCAAWSKGTMRLAKVWCITFAGSNGHLNLLPCAFSKSLLSQCFCFFSTVSCNISIGWCVRFSHKCCCCYLTATMCKNNRQWFRTHKNRSPVEAVHKQGSGLARQTRQKPNKLHVMQAILFTLSRATDSLHMNFRICSSVFFWWVSYMISFHQPMRHGRQGTTLPSEQHVFFEILFLLPMQFHE